MLGHSIIRQNHLKDVEIEETRRQLKINDNILEVQKEIKKQNKNKQH